MNEEFAKRIYKTIIEDGGDFYKELYENTEITEKTIDYWKDALELYNSFNYNQKNIFMNVIKQTMIDTISSVFGILDGSSTLSGGNMEFDVKINGISTEDEMQDIFLEIVEEKENG
ncbi:MAG: hypothetical protein NC412_15125 [Roseburia sp.]|nr:hypothetical protein [Roseburia sp.]